MTTISRTSSHSAPRFSLLDERQMHDLHYAALEVLRRTGVRFHHPGALEMLRRAGAFVSGDLVRLPAHLVEQALQSAPGRIVMCDRDGAPAMALEGTRSYFGTGSDCPYILDPDTGEHRPCTTRDLVAAYRLCDALPHIHFLMSVGIPHDVRPDRAYDVQMALMLEHSVKPVVFVTADESSCRRAIAMAAAVAGGLEPLREQQHILLYAEPSSPLQHSQTAVDKLLLMASHALPVVYSPGPQMGATAPITMAAGLAMAVAEVLSGLVLHQLEGPGAPFVFGAGLHHMDMGSTQISYGSPEFQLTKAAIAQMGRFYGLPTWGYAGCSDAKVLDEQAAAETMLSVVMARLSGANLIHDVGYLESGLCASLELIVLTDELVALSDHLMAGISVGDDTLLLDTIHEVGPGGHFLDHDTTVRNYRSFWFPSLFDRQRRPGWLASGAPTLSQRLRERTLQLVREHRPPPLGVEQRRALEEVLANA